MAPGWFTWRRRSAPTTWKHRARMPAGGQPGPAGRAVRGRRAAGRRDVLQGRRPAADRGPGRPRAAVRPALLRAQLSALLALRHLAAVLRAALVVHQDHRD